MAETLTLKYDSVGDILYINQCSPYPDQESEKLGNDIVVRLNPETGEIENLEVLFFSQRLTEQKELNLPLKVNLQLSDY